MSSVGISKNYIYLNIFVYCGGHFKNSHGVFYLRIKQFVYTQALRLV